MNYHVYENWIAEKKAVIHKASCGHCNNGKGCHANPLGNKNGMWHGPFNSLAGATNAAKQTGKPFRQHSCI